RLVSVAQRLARTWVCLPRRGDPPPLDCCDLLSEINGSEHTRNIRVMMLSPRGSTERTRGLDLGADEMTLVQAAELFRVFRLCSGSLAFYRHLKRPTQHVVVSNCVLSDEHEQVASCCVLRGEFAQRWRVQYHINCVTHLYGNVIAASIRRTISCSLMRLDLNNRGHLILRCGLAKSRKTQQTQSDYTY